MMELTEDVMDETVPSIEQLETIWDTNAITVLDLVPDSNGTILPPDVADEWKGLPTVESLPVLSLKSDDVASPELKIRETIGEGGMGVVKLAAQIPLARDVAVKTLPDNQTKGSASLEVLREARVTGLLEHPNIVPIHTLGRDHDGKPMFVMKRIDGVMWSEIIADPEHPFRKDDERSTLEFHLDVLMHVCNAVQYAHSKGITNLMGELCIAGTWYWKGKKKKLGCARGESE